MPSRVVEDLIRQVQDLKQDLAELKTDMKWIKDVCKSLPSTTRDVGWMTKGVYLLGGAVLTAAAKYLVP